MKILGPGEENGLNINTGINVVSFSHNSVSKTLLESKQAEHFIGLLRHGLTIANVEKDARKEVDEPLLETELGPDSTIRKQARNFLNFGINKEELCIHFDPIVKRDRQTAKVFCDELGLAFPNKEEMVDEKVMERKYPYLKLTRALATREKGSIANNEIPIQGTEKNKAGAESILESRVRVFDYVENLKKNISNNSYKHHIMVGHRTGTNGFIDAKYNRSKMDLINDMKESDVSQLDYGFLNQAGEFINLKKQLYSKQGEIKTHDLNGLFEFDISQYPQQVEELKNTISTLKILSGNNIIEDTNIINAYMENIKQDIVANKTEQKIIHYLNIKNNYIQSYILSFLIDIIIDSKDKKIENILIQYIGDKNISEQEKCRWIAKLYTNNHELRKYILYVIYTNNKSITANPILSELIEEERKNIFLPSDGRLIPKTKIEEEIEKIDTIKEYANIHIDTLLGDNITLKDFYVPQKLSVEGKNISSDDLVNNILQSDKNIFAIQAAGGSGKTILSKYLLMNLSNSSVMQKNSASYARAKGVDLNYYTPENIENIFQGPENILVIDALDEKNSDTVKKLTEISNGDAFKNSGKKLVILGRYIDDNFLYEKELKELEKEKKESVELFKLQEEVVVGSYIKSFTKIIKPEHIQEKFTQELIDIIKILDTELHTPIIIEMLANIVKKKISSGRGGKVFVDEKGNEKKDITRKDIYDRFFQHLHEREDQKSDKIGVQNERLHQNNPFMGEEYDELRKEFLMSIISNRGFKRDIKNIYEGGVDSIVINENEYDLHSNQIMFTRNNLNDMLDFFLMQNCLSNKNVSRLDNFFDVLSEEYKPFGGNIISNGIIYNNKEEMIIQEKNKALFINSLLSNSILKKDKNDKLTFHHKTFEDYFVYLYFWEGYNGSLEQRVEYIGSVVKLFQESFKVSDLDSVEGGFMEKLQNILITLCNAPFFDSKKDLLPLLELLEKQKDSLNNILGEEYYTVIPNFLKEIVGTNSINYDFFTECDKVDEKKAEHNLLRTDGITFIKGDQNQHKILIDKAIEAANTEEYTLLEYQLKIFLNGKSNPMSREYRHLLSIFSPGQNNQTSGISLSKEEKNHLFHLIQLRETKNRGGNKERYIDYQESQQKKSSIYTLESEYLGDFNYLYQLSKYVNKNDEIHYINDLNDIRSKITRASQGKKITGDLYNNIMETTKRYGLDITKSRNYDELPAGFFHVLMGSTTEFLTNKYFGFT